MFKRGFWVKIWERALPEDEPEISFSLLKSEDTDTDTDTGTENPSLPSSLPFLNIKDDRNHFVP
jgi:hypothetical protein